MHGYNKLTFYMFNYFFNLSGFDKHLTKIFVLKQKKPYGVRFSLICNNYDHLWTLNNGWHIMTKGIYKNRSSQEPLRNTQQETYLARLVIVLNWMFILMNLSKYFSSFDAKNVYIKSKSCICSPSCSCSLCSIQSSFWYYGLHAD